ncbi:MULTISPECIES: DUF1284 domain-containing protein [unclassified Wolbachia]|nr:MULTISPECIES: DUF1284 domain-containing protein [unclassified Wolbachia]
MTWSEAVKRIREKTSLEKFDYTCEGCNWKPIEYTKAPFNFHIMC